MSAWFLSWRDQLSRLRVIAQTCGLRIARDVLAYSYKDFATKSATEIAILPYPWPSSFWTLNPCELSAGPGGVAFNLKFLCSKEHRTLANFLKVLVTPEELGSGSSHGTHAPRRISQPRWRPTPRLSVRRSAYIYGQHASDVVLTSIALPARALQAAGCSLGACVRSV